MPPRSRGLGTGAAVTAVKRATPSWASAGTEDQRPSDSSPPASIVTALRAADPAPDTGRARIITVRPDEVAEHPKNPRATLGDLSELADSLKTLGLLQAIVVTPSEEFLRRYPEHAALIADRPWVAIAGHRRRAAAEQIGLRQLEAVVRVDLADEAAAATAFIVENIHRAELKPIEEARTYELLADLGLSQREIASRCSVSQSHVSKRQALLRLPQDAQDALALERLTIGDALALAAAPAEDQVLLWQTVEERDIPVATARAELAQRREQEQRISDARAQAKKERVTLVDAEAEFGKAADRHRLYEASAIENARKAGTLLAAATGQGLTYYTREPLIPAESTAERPSDVQDRDRRRAACRRLVQTPPTRDAALHELTKAALRGESVATTEAVELAASWLPQLQDSRAADAGSNGWLRSVLAGDSDVQTWAAWALTVAQDELSMSLESAQPSERQRAHLERLATAASDPSGE